MPITFIGTSHIAEKSVQKIQTTFNETNPDIVAIEIDKQRLQALFSGQKPTYSPKLIRKIGLTGYLFAIIGAYFQKKFGKIVGIQPEADMKAAAIIAAKNKKAVLLIDQDISITLKKLSRELTTKEKWRFITDILFGWAKKKEKIKIDLKDVPEEGLIEKLLEQLKSRYPTFHKVLLADRNKHMATRLAHYEHEHPYKEVLAVIGAGHLKGLKEDYEKTITFLKEKRAEKTGWQTNSKTSRKSPTKNS